jgi:hypothetical protein
LTESIPERLNEQEALVVDPTTALQQEARLEPAKASQDDRKTDSIKEFDFSSATANVRAFQAKWLEVAQANMQFAFEFAHEYTVIDNRVAIVDPRRREVVEILDDSPGYGGTAAYGRDRIVISDDTRTRFRELVRSSSTTVGSTSPSGGGTSASNCLSLQPVPEELARTHPELSSYRYLAVGDQVVLVDPQQQKIVQVID